MHGALRRVPDGFLVGADRMLRLTRPEPASITP
jgi:hypothetical protein